MTTTNLLLADRPLQVLTIPKFERKVQLSKKQRPKYKKKKDYKRFPKECRNSDGSIAVDKKGYLLDATTGDRLLKNPNQAGKPRYKILNGNDFVYGFKNRYEKGKVVQELKDYLLMKIVRRLKPFQDFPIYIEFFMREYLPDRGDDWDIGNEWYWSKYMEDVLVDLGYLPDDSIEYVLNSGGSPILIPTSKPENRALIWKFHLVTDPRILRMWPWTKRTKSLPSNPSLS